MEQKPAAPPGLERARQHLDEFPGLLQAYDQAVPAQLRPAANAEVPQLSFDAGLPAVEAKAVALEAEMLALQVPVAELQPA
jgi:hypothetical protein